MASTQIFQHTLHITTWLTKNRTYILRMNTLYPFHAHDPTTTQPWPALPRKALRKNPSEPSLAPSAPSETHSIPYSTRSIYGAPFPTLLPHSPMITASRLTRIREEKYTAITQDSGIRPMNYATPGSTKKLKQTQSGSVCPDTCFRLEPSPLTQWEPKWNLPCTRTIGKLNLLCTRTIPKLNLLYTRTTPEMNAFLKLEPTSSNTVGTEMKVFFRLEPSTTETMVSASRPQHDKISIRDETMPLARNLDSWHRDNVNSTHDTGIT